MGLSFDTGGRDFLNFRLDISSIDADRFGAPFVPNGAIPEFEFTLFDNPSGTPNIGSGSVLSTFRASGTASPRNVFDWTEVLAVLDASASTNGNVTLRIDLLNGGYAALDNFRIAASDTPGDVNDVPEPSTIIALGALTISGLATGFKRKFGKSKKK
ncbi:PEP-CTERM sorting domain-containing protein [Crocosphaera sp. Alani8]|uniref:PEP-CTERM sorting domain-containing protein n=1 Tax=Crocosphaera sp. Alani8 TaxID=3038952 RepID=UPI00313C526F